MGTYTSDLEDMSYAIFDGADYLEEWKKPQSGFGHLTKH